MVLLAKTNAFFVARESSRRRQIFDGREGHKGNIVFSELKDCVYKGSQGPARHMGNQNE